MFRYKTKKSTMIIAGMVILLCLVSITGATYALFTSNLEDGKIGINATSGNIEVDIVDPDDSKISLVGNVLKFDTETGDALFEPGAAFRTQGFRVANKGNIPIKYILYISEDETFSQQFTEAFDVWITKEPNDRNAEEKLQKFEGELEIEKESDIYYLVFRMKESAGNEFQNKTFTGIGVTVCAVQGNGSLNNEVKKD